MTESNEAVEYALRKPDGDLVGHSMGWLVHGEEARKHMEWLRDQNPGHNLTLVRRTVTETDWEAPDD